MPCFLKASAVPAAHESNFCFSLWPVDLEINRCRSSQAHNAANVTPRFQQVAVFVAGVGLREASIISFEMILVFAEGVA